MKASLIAPSMDVFDGRGVLTSDGKHALELIAAMVADSLREGGDCSHQAVVWDGPSMLAQSASIVALPERDDMIVLLGKMLNPSNLVGGSIRSVINCRAAAFGYDGQAILCLRHEDVAPVSDQPALAVVEEHPEWLAEADWLDGWPAI